MEKILTIPVRHKFTSVKRTIFKYPKSGVECMFIQLTKDKGVKIFAEKGEAVRSHRRQEIAYKHKLAPKVLSKVHKCFVGNLLEFDIEDVFDDIADADDDMEFDTKDDEPVNLANFGDIIIGKNSTVTKEEELANITLTTPVTTPVTIAATIDPSINLTNVQTEG